MMYKRKLSILFTFFLFSNWAIGQNIFTITVNDTSKIDAIFSGIDNSTTISEKKEFNFNTLFDTIFIQNKTNIEILGLEIAPITGNSVEKLTADKTAKSIKIALTQREKDLLKGKNRIKINLIFNIDKKPVTIPLKTIGEGKKQTPSVKEVDLTVKRFPFNDALYLSQSINKSADQLNKDIEFRTILSHYAGYEQVLDVGILKSIYHNSDNKFIDSILLKNVTAKRFAELQSEGATENFRILDTEEAKSKSILTTSSSALGGLNATIFADAFAKIIVKRFKQDLNEMFFIKMKEEMQDCEELTVLLPRTHLMLQRVDRDVYDFQKYMDGFRQTIEEDLSNMFANTNRLLELQKYGDLFEKNQVLRGFLMTASQFADGLVQKQHPGKIIENLTFSDAYNTTPEGRKLRATFQTIRLFSIGLQSKDTSDGHYWVNSLSDFRNLFKGKESSMAQVWLGLLFQGAVDEDVPTLDIEFKQDTSLKQIINKMYQNRSYFYKTQEFVQGLVQRTNQIEQNWAALKKNEENEGKVDWEQMVGLYENAVSILKFIPSIAEVSSPNFTMPRNWYRGLYIAETMPRIYAEVKGRQYHVAIQHIASLVKAADLREFYIPLDKNNKKFVKLESDFTLNVKNEKGIFRPVKEYSELLGKYIIRSKDTILISRIFIRNGQDESKYTELDYSNFYKVLKYGSFAASMALAKTSDEVAYLLESTMIPPGSTRMKESGRMLSINSFLGVQWTDAFKSNSQVTSIAAPIGISYSFAPKPRKPKYALNSEAEQVWYFVKPHHFQIMGSIIDVGAIAGLRFTNTKADLPKITLENIFSPGIFLMMGRMFNSPINLAIGYQIQPRLFKIDPNNVSNPNYRDTTGRISLNISWDIPFWNMKYVSKGGKY